MYSKGMLQLFKMIGLTSLLLLSGCIGHDAKSILSKIPQNILLYVNPATVNQVLIDPDDQQNRMQGYLNHYFSPWTGQQRLFADDQILKAEMTAIQQYTQNPGFGDNRQAYSQTWVLHLSENMDMTHFPNANQKAIVIIDSSLRVLPTTDPSYENWDQRGQNFPLDRLQASVLTAGTPVLVLQVSQDKVWELILVHNDFGWVESSRIAYVKNDFIKKWQTSKYIGMIHDHVPILSEQGNLDYTGTIGSLYPLVSDSGNNYQTYIPVKLNDGFAKAQLATIEKASAAILPIDATVKNFATLANSMLGNPYGWGGLHHYRDDASTVADLLAPFGVWLPRNANEQMQTGTYIPLDTLTRDNKIQTIIAHGIPFLTLVGYPGHVMLYIGLQNGQVMTFQALWSLETQPIFMSFIKTKQAYIGQTIVVPLSFDVNYINVPVPMVDKVTGMTVL